MNDILCALKSLHSGSCIRKTVLFAVMSLMYVFFCLYWLTFTYYCRRSLKGRLKLSVKGQKGCGYRGRQAGEQCWFVPGEKISQRLSALLFCRNSVDPLLSLFSVWLLWPAESKAEWEGEEKQRVDGLDGEGWQVEVSLERWGCDGTKALGHMTLNSCSICVRCLECSRLPGHCSENGWIYVSHACDAGPVLLIKAAVCRMHIQLPDGGG